MTYGVEVLWLLVIFFAPYADALVIDPVWPAKYKRIVAIVMSLVLSAVVLLFADLVGGYVMPTWRVPVLLAIAVAQASYVQRTSPPALRRGGPRPDL